MKIVPLVSLVLALLAAAPARASVQATYYVDPVSGSDSNGGTTPTTAFATLTKAQAAVESVNSSMTGDIVVSLLPGDYLVTSPINLTQLDSGSNGHNVIWTCYGAKGSARIIGGTKVTGWTLYSGNIYEAAVTAGAQRFEAVYENGVRGVLARYPNTGYLSINADDTTYPAKKFQWKSTDTIPAVAKTTDLQVLVWPGNTNWSDEIHNVATIDRTGRWITLTENIYEPYLGDLTAGSRYFIQGAIELLDQPGEFYYDSSAGILYYYPRTTPIANQEIIVPTTTTLFNADPTGSHSPTGRWEFEQNADDSSPADNDGTAIGSPNYVTSLAGLGDAIALDGATQYVTVPDAPTLEFGATSNGFTIAAWINTTGTGYQPIVVKARPAPGAVNMDYEFWLDATGQLELARWNKANSATSSVIDTGGPALNDGTWHHVAFVNESDTSHKLYIDGSLVTTSTTAWTYDDSNSQAMEIGRYADNNNNNYTYFNGDIDDARIYQSALTAANILAIYQQQNIDPTLQNLVFSNLQFAGTNLDYTNPQGNAEGAIYCNNGSNILIENNLFVNVGGDAINLNGTGTGLSVVGNYISGAGVGGITLGPETSSLVSNNRVDGTGLVFANSGSSITLQNTTLTEVSYNLLSTSKRQGISMRNALNNTVKFNEVYGMDQDSQDTGAIKWGDSNNNLFDHNRAHDSGAFGGEQHGLYVEDGSNYNTVTNNLVYTIGAGVSDAASSPIYVKGIANLIQNNVFDFTTSHSALRTYEILANGAAKNEQVLTNIMYASGTAVTLYDFQSYADNRILKSDYNDFYKTASGNYVMNNIPGADTLGNWEVILSDKYDRHSVTSNPLFVAPSTHNYTLQSGSPALGLGFVQIDASQIGLQPDFIYPATSGQWVFSNAATDITLNGNDGTLTGGSYVADRFGTTASAISLNGSTDYVNVAASSLLTFGNPANPFTIVAWVKTTGTGNAGIVSKARDTNTPNMDYRFRLLAGGTVGLSRWNQTAGVTDSIATTATVNDGNWHHVAFVNETASSHKLYIDGVLSVTSTTTWSNDDTNTEPVRFGQDKNGTTSDDFFGGVIDDVAIMDAALTASQIQDLNHLPHS